MKLLLFVIGVFLLLPLAYAQDTCSNTLKDPGEEGIDCGIIACGVPCSNQWVEEIPPPGEAATTETPHFVVVPPPPDVPVSSSITQAQPTNHPSPVLSRTAPETSRRTTRSQSTPVQTQPKETPPSTPSAVASPQPTKAVPTAIPSMVPPPEPQKSSHPSTPTVPGESPITPSQALPETHQLAKTQTPVSEIALSGASETIILPKYVQYIFLFFLILLGVYYGYTHRSRKV